MNKRLYQTPSLCVVEIFASGNDVIMASNKVVDPITNGGNYDGGQYS